MTCHGTLVILDDTGHLGHASRPGEDELDRIKPFIVELASIEPHCVPSLPGSPFFGAQLIFLQDGDLLIRRDGKFLCAEQDQTLDYSRPQPDAWERFFIAHHSTKIFRPRSFAQIPAGGGTRFDISCELEDRVETLPEPLNSRDDIDWFFPAKYCSSPRRERNMSIPSKSDGAGTSLYRCVRAPTA